MSLSMSKVLNLVRNYEQNSSHRYSSVLLARPDVLLNKPISFDLSRKKENRDTVIWNTAGNSGHADFHFLMSRDNADVFERIYAEFADNKKCAPHSGWIQEFLQRHGLDTKQDEVVAGRDEEVYRKASPSLMTAARLSLRSSERSHQSDDTRRRRGR